MNYHNITMDDMLNGDGLRTVLWVAGCDHHCEGCHNPITWDSSGGIPFDDNAKKELFNNLSKDYISGITFSGGDPLFFSNIRPITLLAKEIKEKFPDKTIWLYTGYIYEAVQDLDIMKYIDVLVDGEFVKEQHNPKLLWRGSENQRVIDIQDTIKLGKIVLHKT